MILTDYSRDFSFFIVLLYCLHLHCCINNFFFIYFIILHVNYEVFFIPNYLNYHLSSFINKRWNLLFVHSVKVFDLFKTGKLPSVKWTLISPALDFTNPSLLLYVVVNNNNERSLSQGWENVAFYFYNVFIPFQWHFLMGAHLDVSIRVFIHNGWVTANIAHLKNC